MMNPRDSWTGAGSAETARPRSRVPAKREPPHGSPVALALRSSEHLEEAPMTTRTRMPFVLAAVLALGLPAVHLGCADDGEEPFPDETFSDSERLDKADTVGVPGPLVNTNTTETQVWTARNKWEDRDTAAARTAGPAWGENSGLNWDEKYALWIESMPRIPATNYGDTFQLTTPWGRTFPMASLECSEVAIFLRIAFASWYELPFYMTATDSKGVRIYFGHFGARTVNSRYGTMPRYAVQYKDYTKTWQPGQAWPQDSGLRRKALSGGSDDNDFIFAGAKTGAYMDEVFLNKRVGHFVVMMLDYFGSMNLANSRNTYNIKPAATRTGDVLIERWQQNGIGHTLVVKHTEPLDAGQMVAELASGSMPRRQPKWDDPVASKNYFTSEYTGGEGASYDGAEYVKLGGGIKRWRVTKNVGGYWMNTWMQADEASWISDTDYARLKTRPAEFGTLLGEPDATKKRDALLVMINDARTHLRDYPASCSARERREEAFEDLYALGRSDLGLTKAEIDQQYRVIDDYIFATLEYTKSKTCCWNSSTTYMYQIIMDYQAHVQEQATQCVHPTIFMAMNGGYDVWKQYAAATDRALQWKAWTADESCPQQNVVNDTPAATDWTPWCSLTH
jgi:hypothetical protein